MEFTAAHDLVTESSHTISKILGEKFLSTAMISGSSFCAGFKCLDDNTWCVGLLSPEEMTVGMVDLIIIDHLEQSI